MWNILSHATLPMIMLPVGEIPPDGYTVEAQTANPNYLTDIIPQIRQQVDYLVDGTPGRTDSHGNLVSIDAMRIIFTLKTSSSGAKNAYLCSPGDISSNLVGVVLSRKAVLRKITLCVQSPVAEDVEFGIRVNRDMNNATASILETGLIKDVEELYLPLEATDELSVYMASTKNVKNPIVILEVVWRD